MRERLGAVLLDEKPEQRTLLADPAPVNVAVALNGLPAAAQETRAEPGEALIARIRFRDALAGHAHDMAVGVHVAKDVASTLGRRGELAAGECWVGRSGMIVSRHGVAHVADERTHGVLERQREIGELEARMAALEEEVAGAHEAVRQADEELARGKEGSGVRPAHCAGILTEAAQRPGG
ncbi:MAG: hypothetical protein MZW92_65510, partial [Comamonadaceae bacterium]|nr:hypothetical protein [Comamonadaceae bacterium]